MSTRVIKMPPRKPPVEEQSADHDLLVRMDERLKILGESVNQMGTNINGRVDRLEANVSALQKMAWVALGVVGILQIIAGFVLAYILKHLP